MAGRLDVGKKYLDDLLALIPEDKRASVAEVFEAPEAQPAIEALGDGYLRQDDYSRKAAANKKYFEDLDAWHKANATELEELRKLKKGDVVPPKTTEGLITREEFTRDLNKALDEREAGVVPFVTATNRMALRHFKDFGEELDFDALYKDPEIKQLGLLGVYDKVHGPKLREKAQKAEDTRINTLVETRVAEERKKIASRPPYPTGSGDVSPLDAMEHPPEKPHTASVDEMVDEYEKLVAQRLNRTGAVSA